MPRVAVVLLVLLGAGCAGAQNAPSSDPFAVSLAQQSVAALTGGGTITDVTLNANVTSILGADNETGTGAFKAKGVGESRIDLSLSGGTRSDVRNVTNSTPQGAWVKNSGASTAYAQHNCWTDSSWFFPALSSLTQNTNPNFIFKYIAQEQHRGVNAQHIQIFQLLSQATTTIERLSTMDFYLDPVSSLPLAIGFKVHPDDDMNTDIPAEIDFANYQLVTGFQVPFHFQRILNGEVVLDVTVTSAVFNSRLPDSLFNLP